MRRAGRYALWCRDADDSNNGWRGRWGLPGVLVWDGRCGQEWRYLRSNYLDGVLGEPSLPAPCESISICFRA